MTTYLVAWTLRSRPPAVANSGTGCSSEITAAVTITERCGVSVSRNNQPSALVFLLKCFAHVVVVTFA